MDFQSLVRIIRAGDTKAHASAVTSLLFLCVRAFRHLPPTFDPFTFTCASSGENGDESGDNDNNHNNNNNGGISTTLSATATADFSRAGSSSLMGGLQNITSADLDSLAPELVAVLKWWSCPSKAHQLLRRASAGTYKSNQLAAITVVPLVEAAQSWQDAFPASAHAGDANIAQEARDAALQAAASLVAANPGIVLQTLIGLAVLPHITRNVNRALLALVKLVPASAHDEKDKKGNVKPNFWVTAMLSFADSIILKRSTMSTVAVTLAAETLLREVLTRGMINKETITLFGTGGVDAAAPASADEVIVKGKKLLVAGWIHLLCTWASVAFDSSARRSHKFRDSVGLLAAPEAHCNARRTSPLYSLPVQKLAKLILGQDATFSSFVVAFCINDEKTVDSVDECLTSTSIPFRSRAYARGRLAVASALILSQRQQQQQQQPREQASSSSSSSPPSASNSTSSSNHQQLTIPFNYLQTIMDQHPGLISEVWPPAPCLIPAFVSEPSLERISLASNLEFCNAADAKDITEFVMERSRLLKTKAVTLKDFILLSQFALRPSRVGEFLRSANKANTAAFWDDLLDVIISNSQNITPSVTESLYAPALAYWWKTSSAASTTEAEDLVALAQSVAKFYMNKCNSGNEKSSVLQVLASVLRAASAESVEKATLKSGDDATAAFMNCFRSSLVNPSAVISQAAWLAFSRTPEAFQTNTEVSAFLKPLASGAGVTEMQKRMCLTFAHSSVRFERLQSALLDDVESGVVVALPDAFLTLGFASSAASAKLASKDEEDEDGNEPAAAADIKKWLNAPECIVGLIQDPMPGQQVAFDPASPTGVAAISPKSFNNATTQRIVESHSQFVWSVVTRGVEVAKKLAVDQLVCGPLITFLSAKRGFIREIASRAVLGTARFKVPVKEQRELQRQRAASSAMSRSFERTGTSTTSEGMVAGASSILASAPRALNAWKYLTAVLLPFIEKKLVDANGGNIFDADVVLGAAYAENAAANSAAAASVVGDLRPTYAVSLLSAAVMDQVTPAASSATDGGEILASVLKACSHPAIIAASASRNPISTAIDTMFEIPSSRLVGRYRPDAITPSMRAARRIFGEPILCSAKSERDASRSAGRTINKYAQLLADNAGQVVQSLCSSMSAENVTIESRRTAGRAFALLQAYLDNEHQNLTSSCLLNLLKDNVKKFESLDPYAKAAMQTDVLRSLVKIIDVELFKKGILKRHGDRPKGVKQEDWEDSTRRDDAKADVARQERLKAIQEKSLAGALERVAALLIPFGAIRYMSGIKNLVSLDSVSTLLSFLMETAFELRQGSTGADGDDDGNNNNNNDDGSSSARTGKLDVVEFKTLPIPAECCDDAAVALLQCTPLSRAAGSMVRVYRLLGGPETMFLSSSAVAEANAFAHSLRLSVSHMLPPELVTPLLLVAKRFFRVYKRKSAKQPSQAAQHQFMSVLATCWGDRNISGKQDAAELLFLIAENFFGLHRMAVNSIVALCSHLSVDEMMPLSRAVLSGSDLGRECGVQGLDKFANQYGIESRIGGILAHAASYDERTSVAASAKNLVATLKFVPIEEDWKIVAELLNEFHHSTNAVRVLSKYAFDVASLYKQRNVVAQWVPAILSMPSSAAIIVIDHLASALDKDCAIRCLEYLLTVIEDSSSDVTTIRTAAKAGENILLVVCPDAVIPDIAARIQPRLRKSSSSVASHRELHNGASINILTALATRQQNKSELEAVLDEVVAMSSASSTAYVHRTACDCVFKLAKTPLLRRSDKIVEVGQQALKAVMNATVYAKKKGHGYLFAGLAGGAGLLYLRKVDFLNVINSAARDRQQQRIAAMILLECCCDIIGEMFEPYSLALTPMLIDGIGEKDEKISECADDAAKSFMRSLSEAGLHQLIPKLIDALTADSSSKKRAPALNLIGYTAFCSPKQLVATLPSIMRHIIDALCDANAAISKAAYHALRRVAGVVSNNEIKEHVDILLEAMRNPAHETENALDALLYTRFFTRVDPASLAILAPVILRGLGENNSVIRGKAAQITGSLVKLVSEERALDAYADEFIKRLMQVVQDPSAGVRATAAKAMASIAAALSDERVLQVIAWALALLVRANSSAERAGAAEAFCEAVAKGGPARFGALMDEIDKGLGHESPSTREGFINIIVYTSTAFSENMFTPLLPTLFNWVLRGLGDHTEQVRNMALQAGSTIITGYGSRTLNFVLGPLVDGVASENSSTRQACLLLSSKLIIHLVQVLRRQYKIKNKIDDNDDEDDEEDEEAVAGEAGADGGDHNGAPEGGISTTAISAREAERMGGFSVLAGLKETIGEERFVRLLAALYMARFEHNANVRAEVHNAWTVAVASIRTAVVSSIHGLIDLCVCFASSDNPECNDLAERILEFTAQRLHETLDTFILSFAKKYEVDDVRHKIGALAAMAEVVPCTDSERLQRLGPHIVSCVLSGSTHENERVRTNAAAVFDRVSKIVGPKWIDSMVEQQLNKSVVGVVELVRVRPVSSLASIFKTFGAKPDHEIVAHDVRLLRGLIDLEETRTELIKHYDRISSMLLAAERLEIPEAASTATAFAESLLYEYASAPVQDLERALKTPNSRASAIRSCAAFFFGIRAKYTDILEHLLRMVIHHMFDSLPEVRVAAAKALQQMLSCLDAKAMTLITDEEQGENLLVKSACGRYALTFLDTVANSLAAIVQATLNPGEHVFEPFANPLVFDSLLTNFYLKYIDHGKASQKVAALEGLLQLLAHAEAKSVIASLVGVGGKCVRFLTSKQEGPVLSATMNLVAFLMTINGGGKEVVFENTLAASLCAAMMCDNTDAKIMADTVAIRLVQKNPLNADKILGGIAARKSSIENDVHKTSLARFVGIVARVAQLEKKVLTLPALWTMIKGYFDAPETMAVAAAAGSCLGALAMNSTVADADVAKLAETALSLARGKSTQAIGALACLASILNNPKSLARVISVFPPFHENALTTACATIENCNADRTIAAWTLRFAHGALKLSDSAVLSNKKTADSLLKIAGSLHKSDVMLHGALDYVICDSLNADKFSSFHEAMSAHYHARTRICEEVGFYDADLEDEAGSDTRYF